jgi:hypothetical protein
MRAEPVDLHIYTFNCVSPMKILIPAYFDVKSQLPLSEQNSIEDATIVQICRILTNYIRFGIVHSLVGFRPLFKTKIKKQSSLEYNFFCPSGSRFMEDGCTFVDMDMSYTRVLHIKVAHRTSHK